MDNNRKEQQLYGRRVWNLLHSTTAYYPEKATAEEQENAKVFIEEFMRIGIDYEEWGNKFLQKMREENPLKAGGRQEFSEWMCRQHNYINKERGIEEFDCSYENLRKRWGPG